MATFSHAVGTQTYRFDSLKDVMAKASPARSGDFLAGVAAQNDGERVAAQMALADIPLAYFLQEMLIPYETDEVTRLIIDSHDLQAFAPVSHLTVGGFRDWLLSDAADEHSLRALAPGLTPEMAAAVSKIMRVQDLILVAQKIRVVTQFRGTMGLRGRLSGLTREGQALADRPNQLVLERRSLAYRKRPSGVICRSAAQGSPVKPGGRVSTVCTGRSVPLLASKASTSREASSSLSR